MKSWKITLAVLTCWACAAQAQAAERLDKALEAAAKCSSTQPMAPALASYRLLLSSSVVVKERRGALTFYLAAVDRQSGAKLWNITPTRILVAEREGYPRALVGSMYSKDFPMSDADIVGSFQGGLGRKITLAPLPSGRLSRSGLSSAAISVEPVAKQSHLLAAKLASGERLVLCAPMADLTAFLR
jgi:hypothetical protein